MKPYAKFLLFFLVLFSVSCSRTKYKGFRQYYTNFVSYYNTYFNIQYKYRVGYRESTQLASENVTDLISVFEFENDPDLFKSSAKFGEVAPKVIKLLSLRPYNKWMDDAILAQGRINYLRGDYDSAVMLLSYVVDNYPKGYFVGHLPGGRLKGYDDIVKAAKRSGKPMKQPRFQFKMAKNQAVLWLIRAYIKKKQYERAQSLIVETEGDMSFPLEYRKDLIKTKAMLKIAREDYAGAIEQINLVLEEKKLSKKEKGRMYFLLAQLNEKMGDPGSANTNYQLALKQKLRDDLQFEAKLKNLTYDIKNSDEALAKLKRMLNKGSNANNLDKLYAAIGNVYLQKGDEENGMKNFKLALSHSKNNNQKFSIYDKIGSLYYKKPNYLSAASYYDSASQVMPETYPNKAEFNRRTEALKRLLLHYKEYIQNDSILDLAALGEDGAIEKIEKQVKKEQAKAKAEELFRETTRISPDNKPLPSTPSSPGGGSWYFAQKDNVEKGKLNFQKKWGKLERIDNWYKLRPGSSNNASTLGKDLPEKADLKTMSSEMIAEIEARNLPFSAEAKKPLIKNVQKSLIEMARIYNFDIKDIKKSIETYELLFKKYPNDMENEDEALYALYRLYLDQDNLASAESIKGILISKFPKSKYTLYANNPSAKSDEEKSDLAAAKMYKEAFKNYKQGNYTEAMNMTNTMAEIFKNHSLHPKILLLRAFIESSVSMPTNFKATLEEIIASHKDSEEAKTAKELLDLLNGVDKEKINNAYPPQDIKMNDIQSVTNDENQVSLIKKGNTDNSNAVDLAPPNSSESTPKIDIKQETKKLEEKFTNYEYDPSSNHYLLYKLKGNLNPASAKTLLDVYLRMKWSHFQLKAEILFIGQERYISIGKLSTLEQAESFKETSQSEPMMQTLHSNSDAFFISTSNLDILYISSDWNSYYSFYRQRYR